MTVTFQNIGRLDNTKTK